MVGKLNDMLSAAVFIDSLSTKSSSTQSSNATAPVSKSESGQSGQQSSLSTILKSGESTLKSADSKQATSLPQQPAEPQRPLTEEEVSQLVDSLNKFFNKNDINIEVRYEVRDPNADSDSDSEKTKESKKTPPPAKNYEVKDPATMKMRYDEEAGLINIKFIEKSTQKVISEFPPEALLNNIKRANEKSREFLGVLIDRLM
jgi:uncharacterized FlaG/YvyC family protein